MEAEEKRGLFVVFEGCDGTGKTTQSRLLISRMKQAGERPIRLKFPAYKSLSSGPVRMYLGGELGEDPDAISPYAASMLYAVDRYCSFKSSWEKLWRGGSPLVADRYVTSNMIFQSAKLPAAERSAFVRWLDELEYGKLGLPRPDAVVFLDLPIEVSEQMVRQRAERTGQPVDIHERDLEFQHAVREAGQALAEASGWIVIDCARDGKLLPPAELSDLIWERIKEYRRGE